MPGEKERKNRDQQSGKRPHIGVIFKCCRVYYRLYLNKKGDAFVGWCPKCSAKMTVHISPVGSESRFFLAE